MILNEYPLTPSKAAREVLVKALEKAEQTEDPSEFLKTILEISLKEKLDEQRTSLAMFACGLAFVKN